MSLIKVADLPKEFPAIAAIRKSVFQQEQGVDPALEFDFISNILSFFCFSKALSLPIVST